MNTIGDGFTGLIQLLLNQTSNRKQLGFFVEGKGFLAIQVDGQSRNAQNWQFN